MTCTHFDCYPRKLVPEAMILLPLLLMNKFIVFYIVFGMILCMDITEWRDIELQSLSCI